MDAGRIVERRSTGERIVGRIVETIVETIFETSVEMIAAMTVEISIAVETTVGGRATAEETTTASIDRGRTGTRIDETSTGAATIAVERGHSGLGAGPAAVGLAKCGISVALAHLDGLALVGGMSDLVPAARRSDAAGVPWELPTSTNAATLLESGHARQSAIETRSVG